MWVKLSLRAKAAPFYGNEALYVFFNLVFIILSKFENQDIQSIPESVKQR